MEAPPRPTRREDFHIGILCALPKEADAVTLMFDGFWDDDGDPYGTAPGDYNYYTTGYMDKYNVVLVDLASIGTISAASASAGLRSSYTNLKLVFVVGICGGLPMIEGNEAVLGDVVISKTIKQYDRGKSYEDKFETTTLVDDVPGRAPKEVRNLVAKLTKEFERQRLQIRAAGLLRKLQANAIRDRRRAKYHYPGKAHDRLYRSDFAHAHPTSAECAACSRSQYCEVAAHTSCAELRCHLSSNTDNPVLVERERLSKKSPDPMTQIFVGSMASGNSVIKSGRVRDKLARELDVVAFEMEGAGAWDEVPCLVIKGICDYADSHKNSEWQHYAAATAAAVQRAVLEKYVLPDNAQPQRRERDGARTANPAYGAGSRVISGNQFGNGVSINMGDTNNYRY